MKSWHLSQLLKRTLTASWTWWEMIPSTVDHNHYQYHQQCHQQLDMNEIVWSCMQWIWSLIIWVVIEVMIEEYTAKGQNSIFKIYSSRTRNPSVMTHNFEVMTVTPGLWTSHNHSSNPLPAVEAVVPYGITLKVMPHNPRVMEYHFPNFLITAHNPRVTGNFPGLSVTLRVIPYGTTASTFSGSTDIWY